MRKSVLIISALTVLVWFSFGPGALPVRAAGLFDDVPANHWAVEAIREMQSRGIIGGFPEDNTFRGNEPLNRYQMVVLVKKLISSLESRESTSVQQVDLVRSLLLEFADDMKFLGELKSVWTVRITCCRTSSGSRNDSFSCRCSSPQPPQLR